MDIVVEEAPFSIRVNGRLVARLLCTPGDLDYLGLGFLKVEGYIGTIADVQQRALSAEAFSATLSPGIVRRRGAPFRLTGCAGGVTFRPAGREPALYDRLVSLRHQFSAEMISERNGEFLARDATHKETGGTHSAALSTAASLLYFASDIGRHNAVQKLAGWALLHRPILDDAFILCTGRISSEMVRYAVRTGVPLIASRSASTLRAIQEAEDAGITLLGFVRGGRMNIYTHPERLA
jgi:FdhD protein